MKVKDYVIECVRDYMDNTKGSNHNVDVFVDCSKRIGYGFVQVGAIIYIPNCKNDTPYNGACLRSTKQVDGWEEFDETELELPFVKKIRVVR